MDTEIDTQIINGNDPRKSDFPQYSGLSRKGQEYAFLTVDALILQTATFMQTFADMAETNTLPDTVFFLDKSARPLAYMFRKLFPSYCPGQAMPAIRFMNIGGSGSKDFDKSARPFNGDPQIVSDKYGKHISPHGQIAVVDEYTHTGLALKHSREILSGAFPEAQITTMHAYSKVPNWYQNESFLGVTEYSKYDYEDMALAQLNKEFGTSYKSIIDMHNDSTQQPEASGRFWEIYEELTGTIPYVKKSEHTLTTYKRSEKSDTLANQALPEKQTTNLFRKARDELDRICEEILKRKVQNHTPLAVSETV